MHTYLLLHPHSFIVAMFPWLIPAFLVGFLPALLLWNLVALLHRLVPALLRWFLPAFLLRYTHTHLIGDSDAALLGHLLASLVGHLLALGVGDRGADLVWCCPALGVGNLLAVLHWQLHTLLPRHLLALLTGGASLHWNMAADSLVLDLVMHSLVGLVMLDRSFLLQRPRESEPSKRAFLPGTTAVISHICTFNLRHTFFFFARNFNFFVLILRVPFFRRSLPLLMLGLLMVVVNLNLDSVAFFLLFHPAFRNILALLSVLSVAGFLMLRSTDLGIFRRAFLGGFSVASFSWFIPTLLRVLSLTLLAVFFMALLIMLSVALLLVHSLTQLFILGLALGVIFSLAGGAVFSLALVLVLFHTHLFMSSLTVRC